MGSKKFAPTPCAQGRYLSTRTCYCLMCDFRICEPFFWGRRTLGDTSHSYVEMLQNFLQPRLNNLGFLIHKSSKGKFSRSTHLTMWLLHGASSTTRSLPFWFFPLGIPEVFKRRSQTIDQLKDAVRLAIAAIPEAMTCRIKVRF